MAYFKKFTIIAFYAFNVLWIISCKKDIQVTPAKNYDPTVGVVSLIKNDNQFLPAKYIFFQVLQNADAIDTSTSFGINVFGKFTDDVSGTIVNAGNIIINNSQKITSGPDNLYQLTYDQNIWPKAKSFMGNFIEVQVTGSKDVDSIKRKLYIPKPLFLYGYYKSISTISNNKSYVLSWNADSQNMFGKVLIQLSYYSGLSVTNNPRNPTFVPGLQYTVGDNGSFVIPASDLKRFPASSYISISISRATENSWPTSRGQIEYIAVTSAYSSPILVQDTQL